MVIPWTDPVVVASLVWLTWLIVVVLFHAFYRPARQGRKVAYMTIGSFLFLSLVLSIIRWLPSQHTEDLSANAAAAHRLERRRESGRTQPTGVAARVGLDRPSSAAEARSMKLQLVGCSHHTAPVELRERLAFSREQIPAALAQLRERFPQTEAVLLSTCNRVELYTAANQIELAPTGEQVIEFLATFHGLRADQIAGELFTRKREEADSTSVSRGGQPRQHGHGRSADPFASQRSVPAGHAGDYTGPLTHAAFQGAMRVARRVATETAIHQRRVSIPSVAVADFASQIFERFDDKHVLVIGAGEMARETLRYLVDGGARHITLVNRNQRTSRRPWPTNSAGRSPPGISSIIDWSRPTW